ncbi:PRE_C2HC domain-containing protein [Trichonephila clavipes]|nr:PRE_C2HC domain-containing protein [Trichonephila clavipes]
MLFIEKNYKVQMATITKEFPKIRSRLTGDFLKLYTDSSEERRLVVQLLKKLRFQFYTIKAKAERPMKVVIKGLPRTTNPDEIKQDLELLGYTPERVTQLIGRKTKHALPIFLITLPRNLDNLKIFDLKTLSYLSIRVEGYDELSRLAEHNYNLTLTTIASNNDLPTDMDFQNATFPKSGNSTPERPSRPTSCARLEVTKADIHRYTLIVQGSENIISSLRHLNAQDEHDPTFVEMVKQCSMYEDLLEKADTKAAGTSRANTTKNTTLIPRANNPGAKNLPPPVFLKYSKDHRIQMKTLNDIYPELRSKLTGEYIKLYSDTDEERRELYIINKLHKLEFQYFAIKPKAERAIKVVIKGLPRNSNPQDIKNDLVELGYTVEKVSKLIGRITKQPLPIFLVSLPRNIFNAKIFELKKVSYMNVTVDGYDGKGVTQCYSCNRFHHTAENCHITPRCLKNVAKLTKHAIVK